MEQLRKLIPALFKLVILLRDLQLRLVSVIDNAHGGGELAVELLLSCLKYGDPRLQIKLLLRLTSGASDGLLKPC